MGDSLSHLDDLLAESDSHGLLSTSSHQNECFFRFKKKTLLVCV